MLFINWYTPLFGWRTARINGNHWQFLLKRSISNGLRVSILRDDPGIISVFSSISSYILTFIYLNSSWSWKHGLAVSLVAPGLYCARLGVRVKSDNSLAEHHQAAYGCIRNLERRSRGVAQYRGVSRILGPTSKLCGSFSVLKGRWRNAWICNRVSTLNVVDAPNGSVRIQKCLITWMLSFFLMVLLLWIVT